MPVARRIIVGSKGNRIRRSIVGVAGGAHLNYHGGPLLQAVEVKAIFWGSAWQSDALQSAMEQFFDFIVGSALIDQLAEYNQPGFTIGHGSYTGAVTDTNDPPNPLDDSQIQAYLQSQIDAGMFTPNANSLPFVFLPSGVSVTLQGSASCQQFCGYHNDFKTSQGVDMAYAVIPYVDCAGCGFGTSLLDSTTIVASHELCEGITDPIGGTGWYDDSSGYEIGDICEGSNGTLTDSNGQVWTVQTEWSNTQNACIVGAPSTPPPPPTPGGTLNISDSTMLNVIGPWVDRVRTVIKNAQRAEQLEKENAELRRQLDSKK